MSNLHTTDHATVKYCKIIIQKQRCIKYSNNHNTSSSPKWRYPSMSNKQIRRRFYIYNIHQSPLHLFKNTLIRNAD